MVPCLKELTKGRGKTFLRDQQPPQIPYPKDNVYYRKNGPNVSTPNERYRRFRPKLGNICQSHRMHKLRKELS